VKFAVIMDPIEGIKKDKDTSYILMKAALERGHRVYHVAQEHLSLFGDQLFAQVREVKLSQGLQDLQFDQQFLRTAMDEMDVVLIRTDPPFDRRYFYTTLLLDFLPPSTRVVNSPQGLRDWNEKLSALYFAKWSPPSLISQNESELMSFMDEHLDVILKPLDGFGGKGIQRIKAGDKRSLVSIQELTAQGSRKIVANRYLKEAESGDKRIILMDGQPFASLIRRAARPGDLNNLDQGGTAYPYEPTKEDLEICAELGPELKRRGLFFVGIDLLGSYLTEINVTSPTGLQAMIRFTGAPLHHQVIEKLELLEKN
jgi:glutathione synthase